MKMRKYVTKTYCRPSHVQRAIFRLVSTVARVMVTEQYCGMTITALPEVHERLGKIIADVSAAMKDVRLIIRRSKV